MIFNDLPQTVNASFRQTWLLLFTFSIILLGADDVAAQTTAFTYQGRLTDGGSNADGIYEMQFKLFDTQAVNTGTRQGPALTDHTVHVTGGIFTETLDFIVNVFTGEPRFLEIGVRPAGDSNPFTVLSPRQQILSSPYAIQTLNAAQLGGIDASNYIHANASGDVGIGTPIPTAKLDVNGIIQSNLGTNNGEFRIGGTTVLSAASGSQLQINGGGFSNVGINGNVGIGPVSPTARLTVSGVGAFNASGAARFDLFNTTANTGFLQHVTDAGLLQFATTGGATRMVINTNGNVGVGTVTPQAKLQIAGPGTNGYTLGVEGNVTQNLANFGFAKAMLHVDQSGFIDRCFNSTIAGNDMSAPPCGFSVSVLGTGIYAVDFHFQVADRFVVVTAGARTINTIVPNIDYGDGNGGGPNLITVKIRETSTGSFNLGSFTIIVY